MSHAIDPFQRGARALRLPARHILFALAAAGMAAAQAQPAPSQTRGALLYETHCIECHTLQVHWRDQRQARDWAGLRAQVRRWQAAARLEWSEADITAVARHLNRTIYRFAQTTDRVSSAGGAATVR